jgi:hypothetical protein
LTIRRSNQQQLSQDLINQPSHRPQWMIRRDPVLHIHIGEQLLRLFGSTAHPNSLRFVKQTESHHKAKIEEFFSNLLDVNALLP